MTNCSTSEIVVTGIGVTTPIGQGKQDFISALLEGRHRFGVLERPGRQCPSADSEPGQAEGRDGGNATRFLGAEIPALSMPKSLPRAVLRTASLSGQAALATLHEAWYEANLDDVDPVRIGLVVGGSNFQQRELTRIHDSFRERLRFLRPTYGFSFMDSDLCGMCTEVFGINGFAHTVGGASASGQAAVLQAVQAVEAGHVDVCIALGALMDLSYWECQGFRSLGAMGSDVFADEPERACRPFDRDRDGFIFGESCGVLVIEKSSTIARPSVAPYARIAGWGARMDANRNPNPSFEGEVDVVEQALRRAGLDARDVDYVNPHATGSSLGDETELNAIAHCGLRSALMNTTKSLIGHGLSAAGIVETIATLLQMEARRLHPSRNLEHPINDTFNLVRDRPADCTVKRALKMSMGFGGMNTALCLEAI